MEDVIKVSEITKVYKLYNRPIDRLREGLSLTHKSYHTDHFALDKIDFSVRRGECLGVIGTNGSGKSTLLKIITGVLNPTSGNVEVHGKISALLELGAGFNMEYSGIENIYLNGTMMGFSRAEMDAKLEDIVNFAEIGEFINQPVKTYSSGMFARLAFAVAINVEPDILIVDEALSVGDIFFQAKCYRKFNEFKENNKTILFVSHDMSSIIKYCDRCLLIDKGKQIALGKSHEIVDIYKKILVNQYFPKDQTEYLSQDKAPQKSKTPSEKKDEMLWKNGMTQNPNAVVYGDGTAEIVDYAVFDDSGAIGSTIYKDTNFTIKMRVHFNNDVIRPIFAYTIKDLKGTEISGTNTMLEDSNLEAAKAGTEITVAFKQTMKLQGAQYMLSFGCTGYEGDRFVVHSRIYDACNLQVVSDRNTIGFVDLDTVVSYE